MTQHFYFNFLRAKVQVQFAHQTNPLINSVVVSEIQMFVLTGEKEKPAASNKSYNVFKPWF